ncbi:MAG: hypothetical protein RL486_508, partial [Actinomycetota bacterium]
SHAERKRREDEMKRHRQRELDSMQVFNAHGGLLSLRTARDIQADLMVVSQKGVHRTAPIWRVPG